MNLTQIKVEYLVSFSDALFAFSITFMALSIQLPNFPHNILESELTKRLGQYHSLYNQFPDSRKLLDCLPQDIRIYKKDQPNSDLAQLSIRALYLVSSIFHRSSFFLWYL